MMWLENLMNLVRREAKRVALRNTPSFRFGLVQHYNPTTGAVQVTFPEDLDPTTGQPTLSPWMPIIMPSAGPGAGDIAAPPINSQAIILSASWGDQRFMFMLGTVRAVTDTMPSQPLPESGPPLPPGPPGGERWITHPSGTSMMLRNDGTLLAGANEGAFKRLATEDFVLNIFNNHNHLYLPGDGSPTPTDVPGTIVGPTDTVNMTAQLKGT